jgi:hypothetical protein
MLVRLDDQVIRLPRRQFRHRRGELGGRRRIDRGTGLALPEVEDLRLWIPCAPRHAQDIAGPLAQVSRHQRRKRDRVMPELARGGDKATKLVRRPDAPTVGRRF